jgi:hypothetical protein
MAYLTVTSKMCRYDRFTVNYIGSPMFGLVKYLIGLVCPQAGQTEHHINNSEAFIQKLSYINLQETDLLVNVDVGSLFTKVPVEDTLLLLSQLFDRQTLALIRRCSRHSSFSLQRLVLRPNKQCHEIAPRPVIANYYMEYSEQEAIVSAANKPAHWYRYADNTCVICTHGKDELQGLLKNQNYLR